MIRILIAAILFPVSHSITAIAADRVGSATKIIRSVTGRLAGRTTQFNRGDSIFRKQRVRAASASFGQFRLNDNSNLAVNANSSIVLDRFVFAGGDSTAKLVLKAARGAFRFATDSMPSKAYKIKTPSSTISVRGTMFDVFVGNWGQTIVTVLHDVVKACNLRGRCQTLRRRCESLRIERNGRFIHDNRQSPRVLGSTSTQRAIPFLVSQRRLGASMRIPSYAASRCATASTRAHEDEDTLEGQGGRGSDIRLKKDIQFLEQLPNGPKLYRFKYNWDDTELVGVMAQDILKDYPETVSVGHHGYYLVDYEMPGLEMVTYKVWRQQNSIKNARFE